MQTQVSQKPHKTRAEIFRDRVVVRLALDDTGLAIAEILKANGPVADWAKVFPGWLIATVDDEIIGCCQVLIGKPAGFLEFLAAKPTTAFKFRAIAIRKLLLAGMATLQHGGASYVGTHADVRFRGVLERLNFVQAAEAAVMVKRIV